MADSERRVCTLSDGAWAASRDVHRSGTPGPSIASVTSIASLRLPAGQGASGSCSRGTNRRPTHHGYRPNARRHPRSRLNRAHLTDGWFKSNRSKKSPWCNYPEPRRPRHAGPRSRPWTLMDTMEASSRAQHLADLPLPDPHESHVARRETPSRTGGSSNSGRLPFGHGDGNRRPVLRAARVRPPRRHPADEQPAGETRNRSRGHLGVLTEDGSGYDMGLRAGIPPAPMTGRSGLIATRIRLFTAWFPAVRKCRNTRA